VQDLTEAKKFIELALKSENPTRRDVVLQLTTEYSKARQRLNAFVNTRYAMLAKAMLPIGIAVVFAIIAAEVKILDASRLEDTSASNEAAYVPYNIDMRRPIQYPPGGGGTTVTKGGGGEGGSTTPTTPNPNGGQSSSR
jgi:hypothetical protein